MNFISRSMIALLGMAALQGAPQARAELSEDWTFCDTCTTKAQFEAAAVAHVGRNYGDYVVEVGNTAASKVYEVSVTISDKPADPSRTQPVTNGASAPALGVTYLPDEADGPYAASGGRYVIINYSVPLSSQTNTQFGIIVAMVKADPILVPPPNSGTYGYESFANRKMEVISPDLYAAMTFYHPGWQQGQLSGNVLKALLNQLKLLEGKGPTACQVFTNGDVACFQLNLADKNAALYINGTAKDSEGKSIADNSGVGSGGGGGVTVNHVSNSPYVTGYQFPKGSYWLMCTYVNGVKISCRVQWVAD